MRRNILIWSDLTVLKKLSIPAVRRNEAKSWHSKSICQEPKILIMDEPFGALDAQTRYSMEEEVQKIAQKDKRTVIFVTNNIEEALMLGDRIILFTTYPAKIKKIYEVNIPKPRDTMGHEFLMLRNEISDNTDLAL